MTPLTPHPATNSPSTELGEFLRSRRDRITLEAAGVRSYGRRRVPGLRREELAQLAGVSVAYLTRLEQGQSQNASDAIIGALARALQLDADERAHLYALVHHSAVPGRLVDSQPEFARSGAVRVLNSLGGAPAVLLGRFNDILAWNRAGHALLAGHVDYDAPNRVGAGRPNQLKLLFLDERVRGLYVDWAAEAATAVASLRYVAAQFAEDRQLAELVGYLSVHSVEFAQLWAGYDVRLCTGGVKQFRHPGVGEFELGYEVLHLPEGNGQRILVHTVEPGGAAEAALAVVVAGGGVEKLGAAQADEGEPEQG
ncbi:MAG: helix-turn-helix transcriptional regulator [Corynebacterium sp.]|nr:helix-turn-helix transcriptional regulator [Corynebacterium sp.]